ncbi:hypothetical protein EAH87_17760 [Sphingomonas koreensis]|nr:hypothetical protein EAH87_17760 [Sphingomonas koreensis]
MDVTPDRFRHIDLHKPNLTAICAGKFFVYGEGRVTHAIDTLAARYPNARITIRVIGSAEGAKVGLDDYIAKKQYRIELRWEQRKPYEMIVQDIANADIAIAVIRDQSYDFGTKIFDYVAAGTPILDLFSDREFRNYFSGCFDTDYDPQKAFGKALAFRREKQILAGGCRLQSHHDEYIGSQ